MKAQKSLSVDESKQKKLLTYHKKEKSFESNQETRLKSIEKKSQKPSFINIVQKSRYVQFRV